MPQGQDLGTEIFPGKPLWREFLSVSVLKADCVQLVIVLTASPAPSAWDLHLTLLGCSLVTDSSFLLQNHPVCSVRMVLENHQEFIQSGTGDSSALQNLRKGRCAE